MGGGGRCEAMAEQWLLFQESRVWFLAPTWRLTTIFNSSSGASNALFLLLWAPSISRVHRRKCRPNTLGHKIKLKIKLKKMEENKDGKFKIIKPIYSKDRQKSVTILSTRNMVEMWSPEQMPMTQDTREKNRNVCVRRVLVTSEGIPENMSNISFCGFNFQECLHLQNVRGLL